MHTMPTSSLLVRASSQGYANCIELTESAPRSYASSAPLNRKGGQNAENRTGRREIRGNFRRYRHFYRRDDQVVDAQILGHRSSDFRSRRHRKPQRNLGHGLPATRRYVPSRCFCWRFKRAAGLLLRSLRMPQLTLGYGYERTDQANDAHACGPLVDCRAVLPGLERTDWRVQDRDAKARQMWPRKCIPREILD